VTNPARIIIIILTLSCIAFVQHRLTYRQSDAQRMENMALLPRSDASRPLFLGFESTYAHYLWIRTVLYFGNHYMADSDFRWLTSMLDIITRLHPGFYPAYEFAGLMLPELGGGPESARVLLERGISALGTSKWNLYFYQGMIYYKFYNDKELAAIYFARAARVDGAPATKLARLAANMFVQSGSQQRAVQFTEFMYATSENPEVRRYLEAKLHEFNARNPFSGITGN
jgi:hypothetical protein